MNYKNTSMTLHLLSFAGAFALSGCGATKSTGTSEVDLSSGIAALPSMSEMLAANDSTAAVSVQSFGLQSLSPTAVSGTAPLLKELGGTVDVDDVFFDGAIAGLEAWTSKSTEEKTAIARNYRGVEGYAGGQGACRMAQETGAVFDRMLSNGSSACYMKKMPAATGAPLDTFAQGANDRLVRVAITNMTQGGGGGGGGEPMSMFVNIKVHGSASTGAGVYKASLFFCAGTSGSPMAGGDGPGGLEEFVINKTTGEFTTTSKSGSHSAEAKAFLKQVGGSIKVDVSKARSAIFQGSHDSNVFKQKVSITGDNKVYAQSYNSGSFTHNSQTQTFTNKNFSVASFVGDSMDALRFLAGAFKGSGSGSCGGSNCTWDYSGGTEFQDSKYVSTTDSTLYAELEDVDLSDSFYADPEAEETGLSAFDCGATADAEIDMDFSLAEVIAVKEACEGDRLFDNENAWQMCEGGRQNEHQIWQHNP